MVRRKEREKKEGKRKKMKERKKKSGSEGKGDDLYLGLTKEEAKEEGEATTITLG